MVQYCLLLLSTLDSLLLQKHSAVSDIVMVIVLAKIILKILSCLTRKIMVVSNFYSSLRRLLGLAGLDKN